MVSFNSIPAVYKNPLVWIEVDPSQAGTPYQLKFLLLADYKIAAGTAAADSIVAVGSVADAKAKYGAGSPLARMFETVFALNRGTPIYCGALTPPSGGVAASGTVQVTAGPTASGILPLYVAGQKVAVSVTAGDTAAAVATKINTALNAAADLPVIATVLTDTVTLTAKWKGITGNDIRVEDSVLGANGGEVLPAGLALTYPASNVLASGAGVPTWTNLIAAVGDEPYKFLVTGHSDTGSLQALDLEYGFTDSGRWGYQRQSYGTVFAAKRDTHANLVTWGASQNSGVISVMGVEPKSPSPVWEWAGAYGAMAAKGLSADPARPLQTLELVGIRPAPKGARFSRSETNQQAQNGLATQSTNASGRPMIMREQMLYQKNALGQADNAYELATTMHTLDEVLTRLRQAVTNKFPRHKLANDGTRFGPGQAIVTPKVIKGELVAMYEAMEFEGIVENTTAFKSALVVERSATDPSRVDVLYPPDLVNQLRIFAVLAQFRLQFPAAA